MKKDSLYRAEQLCEPHKVGVVCVKKRDGKINFTPVTRWYAFGEEQKFICFTLKKSSYSAYRVMTGNKFTVCVPDVSLAQTVLAWGSVSGQSLEKLENYPVEISELDNDYFAITKSTVVFCCRQKQFFELGENYVFICEVSEVYTDEHFSSLFSYDSNKALGGVTRPKSVKNDIEEYKKLKNTSKNRPKR